MDTKKFVASPTNSSFNEHKVNNIGTEDFFQQQKNLPPVWLYISGDHLFKGLMLNLLS